MSSYRNTLSDEEDEDDQEFDEEERIVPDDEQPGVRFELAQSLPPPPR